ncbi:MAG: hypothetical protein GC137_03965 [Alphaproteobacteria bacterium]|nr:hypothetical protein [Alphaproteobacteria bacterium]
MSVGHDLFSLEGIAQALVVCFAIHVAMVPLGLDTAAHALGHELTDTFTAAAEGAAPVPTEVASAPQPTIDPHAGHDCSTHALSAEQAARIEKSTSLISAPVAEPTALELK